MPDNTSENILDVYSAYNLQGHSFLQELIQKFPVTEIPAFWDHWLYDNKASEELHKFFYTESYRESHVFVAPSIQAMRYNLYSTLDADMYLVPLFGAAELNPIFAKLNLRSDVFVNLDYLFSNALNMDGTAVVLNDAVWLGKENLSADAWYELIEKLNHAGALVIIETGFYRLFSEFFQDKILNKIAALPNLFLLEDVSVLLGMPQLNIGLFSTNNIILASKYAEFSSLCGFRVNTLSLQFLLGVLRNEQGRNMLYNYQKQSADLVNDNLQFLRKINLLNDWEIHQPKGIYARVQKSSQELKSAGILAPPLSDLSVGKAGATASRVNLTVDKLIFQQFFSKLK